MLLEIGFGLLDSRKIKHSMLYVHNAKVCKNPSGASKVIIWDSHMGMFKQ
jgi:hypothetical protein